MSHYTGIVSMTIATLLLAMASLTLAAPAEAACVPNPADFFANCEAPQWVISEDAPAWVTPQLCQDDASVRAAYCTVSYAGPVWKLTEQCSVWAAFADPNDMFFRHCFVLG